MLAWNDIEGRLDQALATAIGLPASIALEVTSRINGMDGKFEIVRKACQYHFGFNIEIYGPIAQTLNVLETSYKRYRDGVAHAWIIHRQAAIAPARDSGGSLYEVLVTTDRLNTLYDHLAVLQSEMGGMKVLYLLRPD